MSTGIEWTDRTWNPVVGCTVVSEGCKRCYAKTLHDQRHAAYQRGSLQNIPQYAHPFETIQLMRQRIDAPMRWRKPARIFVNSMSDLFHEEVPDFFLDSLFAVMKRATHHQFQILTKRAERMHSYMFDRLRKYSDEPPANVWLGVSTENQRRFDERVPVLLDTPAAKRFISAEPLLGPIDAMNVKPGPFSWLERLDWVIAGGESGAGARPLELDWLRDLRDQCEQTHTAFFLKQLGGHPDPRDHASARLDGVRHLGFPE